MEDAVKHLVENLQVILKSVSENSDKDDFLKKPGKYLGPGIKTYADFLRKVKLDSFAKFIEHITKRGRNNDALQGEVEKLWELEEAWDNKLKEAIRHTVLLFFMHIFMEIIYIQIWKFCVTGLLDVDLFLW